MSFLRGWEHKAHVHKQLKRHNLLVYNTELNLSKIVEATHEPPAPHEGLESETWRLRTWDASAIAALH
ncbi:hypothetical protein, partial [Salmonella enterica]|uniref:hypothetical protein n=1 Tax=Salmonella enterica TaxID=28901 RepID=UPI0020C1CA61